MDVKMESFERPSVLYYLKRMLISLVVVLSFGLTLLLVVPFYPAFPQSDVDSSWAQAMGEAVAHGFVFGRDVIFTFGPLAAVYSHMYHPATDAFMVGFSAFFAIALFLGVWSLGGRNSWRLLAILPLCISQIHIRDPLFIILPLLLLALVTQWTTNAERRISWHDRITLGFVWTAVSLLPIIKGSFSGPALICSGLACLLVVRRSVGWALGLMVWGALLMLLVWRAAGQPVASLPSFFIAQAPLISGYGEGMSIAGSIVRAVVYAAFSVTLIGYFFIATTRSFGRIGLPLILGLTFVLFVGFKASFIRAGVHELIAGGILLLVGYLALLLFGSRQSLVCLISTVGMWAYLTQPYMAIDARSDADRLVHDVAKSSEGVAIRLANSQIFAEKFALAQLKIRNVDPLPALVGTADAYPLDLAGLFANGQKWSPRPVIQSYAAYTPELLKRNRAHLEGAAAPDHIFFDVSPLDDHYPSMEDGLSWPDLISRYRVVTVGAQFTTLEKRPIPIPVSMDEVVLQREAKVGSLVAVPQSTSPLWAEINLKSTILGRLFAAVFKAPQLNIIVGYRDGSQASYRFIPATGRAGFLLSPTIATRIEFAALQSEQRRGFFKDREVAAVGLAGESGTRLMWEKEYSIKLSNLKFHSDGGVTDVLFDKNIPVVSLPMESAGDCSIEAVNHIPEPGKPILVSGSALFVSGWAAFSVAKGISSDRVFVSLKSQSGVRTLTEAKKVHRPDVALYFKQPKMLMDGYQSMVDASGLHGTYEMRIVQKIGEKFFECGTTTVTVTR